MLELCKLDLKLTFESTRALREDVEDQPGTVDDPTLQERFEVALLARRQRMIENDEIGSQRLHRGMNFFRLAAAYEKPWIG